MSKLAAFGFSILFIPFLKPVLLAFVFALAWVTWQQKYIQFKPRVKIFIRASQVIVFLVFSYLAVATSQSVVDIVNQTSEQTDFQQLKKRITLFAASKLEGILPKKKSSSHMQTSGSNLNKDSVLIILRDSMDSTFKYIRGELTQIFVDFPSTLLMFFLFLYLLFFFKKHVLTFEKRFPFSRTKSPTDNRFLKRIFSLEDYTPQQILWALQQAKLSAYDAVFLTGGVALLQACCFTVGAAIAQIPNLELVFILTFISSLFPLIGTFPVTIGCFIYLQSISAPTEAIIIIIAFALLTALVDNVVRPMLVSSSEENDIPVILSFFALLGAIVIFGFVGLFIGPFLIKLSQKLYYHPHSL